MDIEQEPSLSQRRRWLAITLATVAMQFSFWPLLASVAARSTDSPETSGGLLALGLALVPFVFVVAALGTKHPSTPMAVLKAMGLFIVIGLPVMLLDVLTGTVAGFAAGAVVSLRRDEIYSLKWRWIAVGASTAYVFLLRLVVPSFAIMSGAALPFAIHGIVDQTIEAREAESA